MSTEDVQSVAEGTATILYPKGNKVFYNPVQQFNRDLSVVGIRAWSEIYSERKNSSNSNSKKRNSNGEVKEMTEEDQPRRPFLEIIEALSASGLRAIRYAKEISNVKRIIANDMSASAVESINVNISHNQVQDKVQSNHGDANLFIHTYHSQGKRAHCVDLDPYGSATPFMDSAVQAVTDGGLLLVTCTDLGTLAGSSYPEKCFAQYGGSSVTTDVCHESALRLVLNMVSSTAAKYGKSIEPLLSMSIDFYVRLFIRVHQSPQNVKLNHSKTMLAYHCSGCKSITCQPLGRVVTREKKGTNKYVQSQVPSEVSSKCQFCASVNHIAGPMWGGPLHNSEFIDKMLTIHQTLDSNVYGTLARMEGMLLGCKHELDKPFFISLPQVAQIIKVSCPPINTIASALCNAGYNISETHAKENSLKTDAPNSVVWGIMAAYVQKVKDEGKYEGQGPKENSPGYAILHKDRILAEASKISFELHKEAKELEIRRKSKVLRFQMNPTPEWGPKSRASKK